MKRRMAMLVAVTAVSGVLVMFAPTGTIAQAAVHDACFELGSATLSSPLTYPGRLATGMPPFRIHPHSANFVFSFNTFLCVTNTSVHASGTVHGWCGLSLGSGIIHTGGHPFHWVDIGGRLILTGGVSGIVDAFPDIVSGESCFTGADRFLLNGATVMASCAVSIPSVSVASISLGSVSIPGLLHTSGHLHPHVTVCVPSPV